MQNSQNKISSCAIIVTWNPAPQLLLALVQKISAQCDFLLIDNASANPEAFVALVRDTARCVGVHQLESNIGLASALNIGLREVQAAGYGFAVLFDQDSQVPVSFFTNLHTAYLEAVRLSGPRVAAIGPRLRHPRSGRQMPFKLFNRVLGRSDNKLAGSDRLFRTDFLITSGCMLALEHLPAVGLMKDAYFIDNIDLEWSFRARSKGLMLFGTDHTHLLHAIGEDNDSALVRAGIMVSHSPQRSYYSTRNRMHLWRQRHAPIGWKVRDVLRFSLKTAWLLLFSPQRAEYWDNISAGAADSRELE